MTIKKIISVSIFLVLSLVILILYLNTNLSTKVDNIFILLFGIFIQSVVIVLIIDVYNKNKEQRTFKAIDEKIKIDLNSIVTLLLSTLNISVLGSFGFKDFPDIKIEIEKALQRIQHYKNFPIDHSKVDSFGFYWFNNEKVDYSLMLIDSLLQLFSNRISPVIRDPLYELKLELSGSRDDEFWNWKSHSNLIAEDIQHNFHILNKVDDIYKKCYTLWLVNNNKKA